MNFKAVLSVSLVLAAAGAMARTEPNSFLNKPAWTKADLKKQVATDKVFVSRVMRHYGMTRDQVVKMVDEAQPGTLKEPGIWLVYNCNDKEEIRARLLKYGKGTKVWLDRNGVPFAKMSCFNPMRRGTDDQLAAPQADVFVEPELRALNPIPEPEVAFTEPVATLPEVDTSAQLITAAAPGSLAAVPVPAAGGFAFPWWLGGLAFLRPPGGDNDTPILPPNPPEPPPAVPEPGLLIAFGGAALIAARRKKKNTK